MPSGCGTIVGVYALPKGELLVVGSIEADDRYSLVTIDRSRKRITSTQFPEKLLGSRFYKSVPFPTDKILLVGGGAGGGIALVVDFKGNISWMRSYDRKKMDWFTDAVLASDSTNMYIAGVSGEFNKFLLGTSDVWLLRCDMKGNVLNEHLCEGRSPQLAGPLANNTLAILYDTASNEFVNSLLTVTDSAFKSKWDVRVNMPQLWAYPPSIAKGDDNKLLVAGVVEDTLHMHAYDLSGRLDRKYERRMPQAAEGVGDRVLLVTHGTRAYVSVTMAMLNKSEGEISRSTLYALSFARPK